MFFPRRSLVNWIGSLSCGLTAMAGDLPDQIPAAWSVAESRSAATVTWLTTTYGTPGMFTRYPTVGNLSTGKWSLASNTRDWRDGFWPGTLWFLAQRTGSGTWKQRAVDWSAALAESANTDHDIGFILLGSMGKGWLFHDDLNDPGGTYREEARQALATAAAKLDSRYNKNGVPAEFIRSWDTIEAPYPVCIDNLMNLELLLAAYEMNGRQPEHRP